MTSKTHAFEADTGKILDIVINSLYSNKEIFLRELISNASDAIDKRRYMAATDQSLQSDEPAIKLIVDSKAKTLTIQDNGIGLSDIWHRLLVPLPVQDQKPFLSRLSRPRQTRKKIRKIKGLLSL